MNDRAALVLGGGGITGAAWEIGLLAGLVQAGVDLTTADLVVGTSAGSVVGAQILSGVPLDELYLRQLKEPVAEIPVRLGLLNIGRVLAMMVLPGDDRQVGARVGRAALRARTMPESTRRSIIASRLPANTWPERDLRITAVDAETGEFVVFKRDSGVELAEAVAASCAAPLVYPPITIKGRRYVDGGVRSGTNADLAAGCNPVVVLAPFTLAVRRRQRAETQLASLGRGIRSIVVTADGEARKAMGRQALDPAHRAASARAGKAQAPSVASAVAAVWSPIRAA